MIQSALLSTTYVRIFLQYVQSSKLFFTLCQSGKEDDDSQHVKVIHPERSP